MTGSPSAAVLGVALSDSAATQLLTGGAAQNNAALQDVLDLTQAGVIYLGADRHTGGDEASQYIDPLFSAQALLSRFPYATALVSSTPDVEHPYNFARRLLTIDHFTGGRIGAVLGVRDRRAPYAGQGSTPWTEVSTSPELTADFAAVLRRLWNSWPRDSIIVDKDQGIFADPSRIVRIDYKGLYAVAGPLNSSSSVQGEPPLGWQVTLGGQELPFTGDAEFLVHDLRHSDSPFEVAAPGSETQGHIALLTSDSLPQLRSNSEVLGSDDKGFSPVFPGGLIYVETLAELPTVAAQLKQTSVSGATSFAGTLRDRLGLTPRSLDITDYPAAFSA